MPGTGQQKSIALIVCYYGKLPWYFNYFVHSCRYNPTVDFFIVTDDTAWKQQLPPNVTIIYKTLNEVNQLASQRLGLPIEITNPYKLCDFKPAYGLIFADLVNGYDFWGHCDIDLIFGNIRDFITDELLETYELISVRHDWLSGCFLLYKNCDKMNRLFSHSKDHQKVFCSDRHYCFDETNFAHDAFHEGKPYDEITTEIESMTHVVKKMEAINYIRPYFDFYIIEGLPGRLRWENGKMFYKNRYEVLFYHLIYFKKLYSPKNTDIEIPDSFTISPTKIYHKTYSKSTVNEF
jgi:hypothetical protein